MIDTRFYLTHTPLSFAEVTSIVGEAAKGATDSAGSIVTVGELSESRPKGAVVFVSEAKYLDGDIGSDLTACFIHPDVARQSDIYQRFPNTAVFEVNNPKAAFAAVAERLHSSIAETAGYESGPEASVDDSAWVHETAVIGSGAVVGREVRIGPNAVIGPGVTIGSNTAISANVTITHAEIGQNCQILAGATIGESGFGFVQHNGRQMRIPQLGIVRLEDEVEIGANTTIDRGMLSDTVVGEQTKIDNLVQVGHNVVIGKRCAIASQTGISGSTIIGDDVMIGGQAGLADHLNIGDGAMVYARAGLMKDVPAKEKWGGYPAKSARQWFKEVAAVSKLAGTKTK